MGSPHPAGGIRTPFPTLSPQGSALGTLSASPKGNFQQTTSITPQRLQKTKKSTPTPPTRYTGRQMALLNRLTQRLTAQTKERRTKRLTVRLKPATYKALERLAQAYQISVSELAYEALQLLAEEYLLQTTERPPKQRTKRAPMESLFTPTQ